MAERSSAEVQPQTMDSSTFPTKPTSDPLASEHSESRRFSNYAENQLQKTSPPPSHVSSEDELSQEEDKDPDIKHDILQSYQELQTYVEHEPQMRSIKGRITPGMLYLAKPAKPSLPAQRPVTPKTLGKSLEDNEIRVFAMTWNMHGKLPTDISQLIPAQPEPHIYLIASQECMRSISKSLVNQNKELWEQKLAQTLGDEYVMLRSHTMVAIHLSVFVHKSLQPLISAIESADIGTGWARQGNKGAVAVTFTLGSTSFLCVCCHLASGQNSVKRRNEDFMRINKELRFSTMDGQALLSDSFDVVVWMGDMNYRISGSKEAVEYLISQNNLEVLQNSDQLSIERRNNRFPSSFVEGEIKFPPTYRFDHGTDNYDTSRKQRVPGWCDRILYRSRKDCLKQKRYASVMEVRMSDHKPVVAEFELKFESGLTTEQPDFRQSKRSSVCAVF